MDGPRPTIAGARLPSLHELSRAILSRNLSDESCSAEVTAAGFGRDRTADGTGPAIAIGGGTQVHRLRTVRLAALLVGLAMVAAACGGGGDEGGGGSSGGTAQVQPGGTLNYA